MLAEYLSKYKAGISLTFAVLFSLTNLISQTNIMTRSVDKAASVLDFFSGTFHALGDGMTRIFDSYGNYNNLKIERDALRQKILELQQVQFRYEMLERENKHYRQVLQFQKNSPYSVIPAEVISLDPDNLFHMIIVNKGSNDGVKPYMPVIAFQVEKIPANPETGEPESEQLIQGVVGKVIQVTPTSARILPVTDQNSKLGVRLKRNGSWALLQGSRGRGALPSLSDVNLSLNLQQGDEIITSGDGGIFPKGLPVGVIEGEIIREATAQRTYIKPYIHVQNIENVLIISNLDLPKERKSRQFNDAGVENTLMQWIEQSDEKRWQAPQKARNPKKPKTQIPVKSASEAPHPLPTENAPENPANTQGEAAPE